MANPATQVYGATNMNHLVFNADGSITCDKATVSSSLPWEVYPQLTTLSCFGISPTQTTLHY
jgi:hypothetical protein